MAYPFAPSPFDAVPEDATQCPPTRAEWRSGEAAILNGEIHDFFEHRRVLTIAHDLDCPTQPDVQSPEFATPEK